MHRTTINEARGTEAFNSFVPPTQYKRAARVVADEIGVSPDAIGMDENAYDLIRMAQDGNKDAQLVLYRKSREAISYAFWKNFIGPNKRFVGRRLDRGDDDLFAAEAWQTMVRALDSFDIDKYDPATTTNVLGKWHWWFMQYLKAEAIRLNKEIDRHGFTGVGDSSGLHVSGMPEDDEGREIDTVSLSQPGRERELELEDALESFIKDLEADIDRDKRKRVFYDILTMRMEGMDIGDIATELGTSQWNIRKYLRDLKNEMRNYGIFESRKGMRHLERTGLFEKEQVNETGHTIVPDWKPLSDLSINEALRFRKRKISDMITHHVSPAYLIVETTLPNRKATYTLYFRLPPPPRTQRPNLEYANHVDLLISNHRTPRVKNMSMAKQLLRQHFKSRGESVKTGIDPASPHAWLHAL